MQLQKSDSSTRIRKKKKNSKCSFYIELFELLCQFPSVSQPVSVPSAIASNADAQPAASNGVTLLEQATIDIFVRMADALALPKSAGKIYGLLFATVRPLPFHDIIDRLKISQGSASQGLRLLRTNRAVRVVYVPGDRRDHFVPETELRALISGFLREKIQPHLESGAVRIEGLAGIIDALPQEAGSAEDLRVLKARVEKLGSWQKKARTVAPLIVKLFG